MRYFRKKKKKEGFHGGSHVTHQVECFKQAAGFIRHVDLGKEATQEHFEKGERPSNINRFFSEIFWSFSRWMCDESDLRSQTATYR